MSDQFSEEFASELNAAMEAEETAAEETSEGEATVEDDQQEAGDTSTEEPPSEEEAEETEPEQPPAKVHWKDVLDSIEDWDGFDRESNLNLPPSLAAKRQEIEREYQKHLERQRENAPVGKQQQAAPPPQDLPEDDPEPPMPPAEADDNTYRRMMSDWAKWQARQVIRQEVGQVKREADETRQQYEQRIAHMEQQQQRQYAETQMSRLREKDGYTQDVERQMEVLAQSDEAWAKQLFKPEGVDRLFDYAKYLVDSRTARVAKTTHAAEAKKRVVPKATSRSTSNQAVKPATGETLHDIARAFSEQEEFRDLEIFTE